MKKALVFFLLAVFAAPAAAQNPQPSQTAARQPVQQSFDFTQYGVRIEPDRRLIVVMASLEAAGLETSLSKQGEEFRRQLKADLASLNPNTRQKLQIFLAQYRRRHPNQTPAQIAAPFVSLAYALSPVPELQDTARTADLPADLLEVFDFAPLVREFYRQSNFGANLEAYMKAYQAEGDKLRPTADAMIRALLDYLHTRPQTTYVERVKVQSKDTKGKKTLQQVERRTRERRFFIVPDLLAPAGTINFRNVGDDYYVVVPPGTDLTSSEARRAFLQFVLDPLILNNAGDINTHREGIRSLLEERRKANPDIPSDIFLAVSRSVVAAADARQIEYFRTFAATNDARRRIDQVQGDEAKRAISAELARFKAELADETALELSEAYERGAVLSFFFAEQLRGIEESGFDIAGAFRDMILSLDVSKETNRLAQFAEARKRAAAAREERRKRSVQVVTVAASPREIVLAEKLQKIEEIIKAKDFEKAEAELAALNEEYPGDSRVFYARGRVASLWASGEYTFDETLRDERLGRAAEYYSKAIQHSDEKTDKVLLLRAYVALGRILQFNEQNAEALREFEAAIKIGDSPVSDSDPTGKKVRDLDMQSYNEAVAMKAELQKNQQ